MRLVALLVLGACGRIGFAPQDATGDPDATATTDGMLAMTCDPADSRLVACFDFEDNAIDGSGHGHDATTTAVSCVDGPRGRAIKLASTSKVTLAVPATFDTQVVTIEMWISPDMLPPSGRMMLFDDDLNYAMGLLPAGGVFCAGPGLQFDVAPNIATATWTHVACTFDGTHVSAYRNGATHTMRCAPNATMLNR